VSGADLLSENRLALPPTLRLAAGLGLGLCRTPEELAAAISRGVKEGSGMEAR
jgi:hypothetical protein